MQNRMEVLHELIELRLKADANEELVDLYQLAL
jgi:hypothetical protein